MNNLITTATTKVTMLASGPTAAQAVKVSQDNIKWGFGTAGIVLGLIGLAMLFFSWDDGPAARRSPIFMLVGGLLLVGVGFAIAAAITTPPGT
ncbi:MAG: hypothetical protein ACRCR5_09680 [Lactococcus garvieae]